MLLIWRKIFGILFCLLLLTDVAGRMPRAEGAILSQEQEIDLGRSVARQVEKQYGLVDDPAVQERVNRIGQRIVAICDRKDLPYTFKVLDSPQINAFACPGGFIYIYKGLVDYMSSDDELAGIIGHEVGHVVKRHTVHQIEKGYLLLPLVLLSAIKGGGIVGDVAASAVMAGYSREDERVADHMGIIHTMRAGYNPYSMLVALEKLCQLKHEDVDWFTDHPGPEARIVLIKGYMKAEKIDPDEVVERDNGAYIQRAGLALPPLYATYQGLNPLYRAQFLDGMLFRLSQLPDLSGDHFILDNDGTNITVMYDDQQVVVLTPQDALDNKTALDGLAEKYVIALKTWADNSRSSH
jgi:Zn-dependent protease with chaperone function